MTIEQAANEYAENKGYPQSDKEHFETTYWTQHNIAAEAFLAGASFNSKDEAKEYVSFKIENVQSSWSQNADFRLRNRKWLRYSNNIARRVLAAIEDKDNFNQSDLAKLLEVTPQQISKIVKGKENLTLKTIADLATVLEIELISFPDYKYSRNVNSPTSFLAGASFNKDAVEFAEWCDENYFGIDRGLWATSIGEIDEKVYTTQELYNLYLNKDKQ